MNARVATVSGFAWIATVVSAVFGIAAAGAQAQEGAQYPTRPVRLIVPFPPGGGTDIVGRLLAQRLGERLDQNVIVDNRPGAASTIGSAIAARATPDGYTLLLVTASYAMSATYYRDLPYQPVRDFAGVSLIASGPLLFVVHPAVAATSIRELIAVAKSAPDTVHYASGGAGGINHLAGELFNSMAGTKLLHVPYKGAGPALRAVVAGEVQLMIATLASSLPLVRSGKIRALALAGDRSFSTADDLPTISAAGLPGYTAENWYGMLAPKDTPVEVIRRLSGQIAEALKSSEFSSQLIRRGFVPLGSTPDVMDSHLSQEVAKWAKVIKASGMSAK
jgi:tripartite-type tricarboxylate transporter receptor subunit TctC